ncbi:MAG: P1 family peptidase [Steroidobacteraceae bacterium]
MKPIAALTALLLLCAAADAAEPRARELGVPFDGRPGALDAITDVSGVTVGQVTLIEDLPGGRAVRTGVTAILPRGRESLRVAAYGGWFALNGNGETTGTTYLSEFGQFDGPIVLTNTHSVGVVRDAVVAWRVRQGGTDSAGYYWSTPIVAETWDGDLNDVNGFHVRPEHVDRALEGARGGPVAEGSVGGGTGMVCHEFKCGIGTASRVVKAADREYTVGVLVQANYGVRDTLTIAGVPVGRHLPVAPAPRSGDTGSIVVVVATDAPLLPYQLDRVAKRATLGLARLGSYSGSGSGDIFFAFSTANASALTGAAMNTSTSIGNDELDPLFRGTVEATEEAIVNALVAGRDMRGDQGHFVPGLPHDRLVELLKQYGRYAPPSH